MQLLQKTPSAHPSPGVKKKDKKAFKEHRNKKADEKDQDSRRSKKPAWGRLPSGSRFPLLLCCFCCLLSSAAAVPGSSSNGTLDAIKPWPPPGPLIKCDRADSAMAVANLTESSAVMGPLELLHPRVVQVGLPTCTCAFDSDLGNRSFLVGLLRPCFADNDSHVPALSDAFSAVYVRDLAYQFRWSCLAWAFFGGGLCWCEAAKGRTHLKEKKSRTTRRYGKGCNRPLVPSWCHKRTVCMQCRWLGGGTGRRRRVGRGRMSFRRRCLTRRVTRLSRLCAGRPPNAKALRVCSRLLRSAVKPETIAVATPPPWEGPWHHRFDQSLDCEALRMFMLAHSARVEYRLSHAKAGRSGLTNFLQTDQWCSSSCWNPLLGQRIGEASHPGPKGSPEDSLREALFQVLQQLASPSVRPSDQPPKPPEGTKDKGKDRTVFKDSRTRPNPQALSEAKPQTDSDPHNPLLPRPP